SRSRSWRRPSAMNDCWPGNVTSIRSLLRQSVARTAELYRIATCPWRQDFGTARPVWAVSAVFMYPSRRSAQGSACSLKLRSHPYRSGRIAGLALDRLKPLILIFGIAAVVVFSNLGGARLWDRDEPRNAGCAREMLERGDWIVPTFNGELRPHKPVLLY